MKVNNFLKNNLDINFIGLDRGERNLVYLVLTDQKKNIKYQVSLNKILNVDYHALLDNKEENRNKQRKEWNNIEVIKDLKKGYMSKIVHVICKFMIDNNAIIVLEDLNIRFKEKRYKFEKQVYQLLETALIKKLNYLAFKNYNPSEPGGILNAYQLTNKFEGNNKMKQNGFIFYVPAQYTTSIDITTGFVDFLKPKYKNREESKTFFSKFNSIKYNKIENYFEFSFDYNNFTTKAEGTKTKWTVCTYGKERYYYNPSNKSAQKINITEELKTLFENENIEFNPGNDLKEIIQNSNNSKFFNSLTKLLNITLQMRYTCKDDDRDFILSPVKNKKGEFFFTENSDDSLPKNADANGAYCIALKGLWCLQQINKTDDLQNVNLYISTKEWLKFVQDNCDKLICEYAKNNYQESVV